MHFPSHKGYCYFQELDIVYIALQSSSPLLIPPHYYTTFSHCINTNNQLFCRNKYVSHHPVQHTNTATAPQQSTFTSLTALWTLEHQNKTWTCENKLHSAVPRKTGLIQLILYCTEHASSFLIFKKLNYVPYVIYQFTLFTQSSGLHKEKLFH